MLRKVFTLILLLVVANSFAQIVSNKPEKRFKCQGKPILFIDINGNADKLIVGYTEYADVFDLNSGKKLFTLEMEDNRHDKSVFYVSMDETGDFCATISRFGFRKIWDLHTGKEVKKNNSMHWLPTPQELKLRGLVTSNTVNSFPYQQTEMVFPNSTTVVAKASNAKVLIVNSETGETLQTLSFPKTKNKQEPPAITFISDWVVTGTDGGFLGFYKIL